MKLTFKYDRTKDVWCVLNYGKTSMNLPTPTQQYSELVHQYGDHPSESDVDAFIELYLSMQGIDSQEMADILQQAWEKIAPEYHKRAEVIFGVTLPRDVTAYLTINERCPYSIEQDMFFVSTAYPHAANKTAMHELWHFYTWFKYGIEWEEKLGKAKYNEIKESLTVLLNIECKDLLPEGIADKGYQQHQELRQKIIDFWSHDKNMDALWNMLMANP